MRCAGFIQPGVRLAVVGVVLPDAAAVLGDRSHQADFVTVVNSWRAGHGHLHQSRALQFFNCGDPVVVWIQVIGRFQRVGVFVQHKHSTVGIVAAEEVHHGIKRFRGVAFLQVEDALVELAHVKRCQGAC